MDTPTDLNPQTPRAELALRRELLLDRAPCARRAARHWWWRVPLAPRERS